MPSGAKKRKAAKKKKSSTTNPLHQAGENDSGELSSPTPQDPLVEVVKREEGPSEPKDASLEVEIVLKSKKSSSSSSSSSSSDSSDDESRVVEKNVVVLESALIESVNPAVESEKITPIVEAVKPVDALLEEVSQVFDEIKNEGGKDLVVEETSVVEEEQTVGDCENSIVVVETVLKENEVEKWEPLVEKATSDLGDYVSSSTPPKDLISDVNGADCAVEVEVAEHSDRQAPAPAASTPIAVQNTTSWKCCCGLFELFSGSGR